jgi:hypothetical protein
MHDAVLEEKMQLQLHDALCKQLHAKDLLLEQSKSLLQHKDEALAAATSELQHCKRLLACQQLVTMSSTVSMPAAESPKRQRCAPAVETAAAAALRKDSNLDLIFSFVGSAEWCFLGDVDRRWRGLYLSHCVRNAGEKCVTSVRAAFMSENRMLWSISTGLRVRGVRFCSDNMNAELICRYSLQPECALGVAKLHGCEWTTELTAAGQFLLLCVYYLLHCDSALRSSSNHNRNMFRHSNLLQRC